MLSKNLRKIHLYIGCLFAPALIFFIVTGCWQTFRLNDAKRDGSYTPPAIVKMMSSVHLHQKYQTGRGQGHPSEPFKIFVLAMSVFLLVTTATGLFLALQSTKRKWVVWVFLTVGTLLPTFLLCLG